MMNYPNGTGLRWYQRVIVATLVAGFEGLYQLRRLLGIAALLAFLAPTIAGAAGTTVVERYNQLCSRLGKQEGCQFQLTPAGSAWLTLIITDHVSEPGAGTVPGFSANMTIDAGKRGMFARVFQVGEQLYGQCAAIPACVTVECIERRPEIEGYTGPTEKDMLSTQHVLDKAMWQTADPALAAEIRAAYRREGLPILTQPTRITIIDGSDDPDRPTIVKMRARFAFAE